MLTIQNPYIFICNAEQSLNNTKSAILKLYITSIHNIILGIIIITQYVAIIKIID